ncbi:hypothetical protein D9615_001365 [Tricholomella constricta]|uniref:C2H2-type domain-containing protein n=1 Tax=Tricholomella constricta TaxID=117010 RepID=A0A8H5HKX2_9AGAR|nr:hypothetical protein D9615_001365 [Tricholomella constricta]
MPSLPSVLPGAPALQDSKSSSLFSAIVPRSLSAVATTNDQLNAALALAKVTSPDQTPIYICGFQNCCRLYPTRERLMAHRKRDHDSQDDSQIITWNE